MKKRLINLFQIQTKEGKRKFFQHNPAQLHYEQHRAKKNIILKARQIGFTTYEQLRKLEKAMLKQDHITSTIAHTKDKTLDIFRIAQFAWDNLPEEIKSRYKIQYDSAKELTFGATGSRYFVDTNTRSKTVHDLHVSEVARIKDLEALFSDSIESVPMDGEITLETTAQGLNQFYDLWKASVEGKTDFKPHFYNWTWNPNYASQIPAQNDWKEHYRELARQYGLVVDIEEQFNLTPEQFYWYYLKARALKTRVKEDYPTVPEEAFLSTSGSVFDLFAVSQLVPMIPIENKYGVDIFYRPIPGHDYAIGIDTAEGTQNDGTSLEIWDLTNEKKVEVASFLDNTIRPDQVADIGMKMSAYYNDALLIPEKNSSGLTTTLKIQESSFQNLFVNKTIDSRTQEEKNEYGWRTTSGNRDIMIDDFIELFEEGNLEINSSNMISQMKTFVRKPGGKREHDEGFHDDSLFASFLAIQGGKYLRESSVITGIRI
jgi:hypothetical protein